LWELETSFAKRTGLESGDWSTFRRSVRTGALSPYHESKRLGEAEVRTCRCDWTIVRPGGVYGPGDETISAVLKMVHSLPVVPVVGGGKQVFQPIWFEDLGVAIARCVTEPSLAGQTLDLAGTEQLTVNSLIERSSPTVGFLATVTKLAVRGFEWLSSRLGAMTTKLRPQLPLSESTLTMLLEGNFIQDPADNALPKLLRNEPTLLSEGLRRLVDELPELEPDEGIGRLTYKRFWCHFPREIAGGADGLMDLFQQKIGEIMPIDFCAEPGGPECIAPGGTLQLTCRSEETSRSELKNARRKASSS
jgi:hypothetical protein